MACRSGPGAQQRAFLALPARAAAATGASSRTVKAAFAGAWAAVAVLALAAAGQPALCTAAHIALNHAGA